MSFEIPNPFLYQLREGSIEDPYVDRVEVLKPVDGKVLLSELPVKQNGVLVDGHIEISSNTPSGVNFYVDYTYGVIYFVSTKTSPVTVRYKGRGFILLPSERIYHKKDDSSYESLEAYIAGVNKYLDEARLQQSALQIQVNNLVVNGDSSPEASQARQGIDGKIYSTLKERIDTEILLKSSASPKGVFSNLSELRTAKPSGDEGVYVVSADGQWYYWNKTDWVSGGTYQSTALADKSVSSEKITLNAVTPETTSFFKMSSNLFNYEAGTTGFSIDGTNGQQLVNANFTISSYIRVNPSQEYAFDKISRWYAYDSNKRAISGGTTSPFTTPVGTFYLRVSVATASAKLAQLNLGNTALPFEEYKQELKRGTDGLMIYPSVNTVSKDALQRDSVDPFAMVAFKKSTNLFNKGTSLTDTSVSSSTGQPTTSTGRYLSDYIPVKPLSGYSKKSDASFPVAYYDKNKQFISYTSLNIGVINFTTPASAYFIRGSVSSGSLNTFQINEGNTLLPYEDYKFELRSTPEFPLKLSNAIEGAGGLSEQQVNSIIQNQLKPFRSSNYTKLPYADMIASLSSTGCEVETLGLCVDGVNRLYGLKYGDTVNKPVIYIQAAQHGSEWRACYYTIDFMKRISGVSRFYDTDIRDALRNNFSFYAIVCVNPTGYINQTYMTSNGVNLNRNWDQNWASFDDSGVNQGKGTAPFSEPETKIARDKILQLQPYLVVDAHTTGETPGGIDTGKYFTEYRDFLFGAHKEIYSMFNDADLEVQEWNLGANPTAVGWSGKQTSKNGTKTIATILEQPINFAGNYGLTTIFVLAYKSYKKLLNI